MAEKSWRDIPDVKKYLEEGGDTAHAFAPRDEKWRTATPDEERAVRLECVRLVMGNLPLEPVEGVVSKATELSDFILGPAKAE